MAFQVRVHHNKDNGIEDKKPTTRVKKADRGFQPTGVEVQLRPSSYGLADRLMAHFQRVHNDRAYGRQFDEFYRAELRRKFADQERLEKWLDKKRVDEAEGTQERFIRARASELKACGRMQAMRMMGFTQADTGLDSPHWGVSASSGEQFHLLIEVALRFLGLVKRSEFTVKTPENDLGGRVDAELKGEAFGPGFPDAIADVKTIGTDQFKEGTWNSKVPGYVAQVTAYAKLTGN